MRVAINGWFWDAPNVGSGQYVRELVRALRRVDSGLQLTLVMPPHIAQPQDVPNGVEVVPTRAGIGGKLGKVWFEQTLFPQAVKALRADVAHVPYWGSPLSVPAKLVTSVLDVIPLMFPEYAGGFATKAYTSLVRAGALGSAHIITLSEASKRDITTQLGYPAERISAIHLAPKDAFHPKLGSEKDAAVRQKYKLPTDPFILYLGGFDVRKRVTQLLAAYTYVVKVNGEVIPLVLAGTEPDWTNPLYPDLRAAMQTLEVPTENVYWTGYIDEADKPSLYRLADLFVYPSAYEGFGLPILEAMASGTPVIANDIPVFDEIVGNGAFLIQDGSDTKMGGALLALLEQKDLYESMVNSGIARASNFTWRKTARETLAAYEQALAYKD